MTIGVARNQLEGKVSEMVDGATPRISEVSAVDQPSPSIRGSGPKTRRPVSSRRLAQRSVTASVSTNRVRDRLTDPVLRCCCVDTGAIVA
jgi:hypothetical protein